MPSTWKALQVPGMADRSCLNCIRRSLRMRKNANDVPEVCWSCRRMFSHVDAERYVAMEDHWEWIHDDVPS